VDIQLVSLELEGFRSFRKRTVIPFPRGNAVMLISGHWKGSEVSSGSGKTTILEAIAVCLGISNATLASIKNWDSKKIFLKLTIQIGPDLVEVVMDPKLSLIINGEVYPGLTKGPREHLLEMLGTNADMLKMITYRKQRVKGTIIRSTDSQLKEFLTQPLNLGEVELAADEFTKETNRILEAIKLTQRDIQHYDANMSGNYVSQEDIDKAYETHNKAKLEFLSLGSPAAADGINAEINAVKTEQYGLRQEISVAAQEIKKINDLNYSVNSKKTENANVKNQILSLQDKVAKLEKNACPTCEREWDAAKAYLDQTNAEIDRLVEKMKTNITYIKNAEPILNSLQEIVDRHANLMIKDVGLNERLRDLNGKLGSLSAPFRLAESAMNSAASNLQTTVNKANFYQKQLGEYEKLKLKLATEEANLAIEQHSAELLGRGGFLGCIFDEILQDIEVRTNDMLSYFPNARHFTVTISSNKLVKTKGTTKKEISVTISRNGLDVDLDDNLSGGQQGAIELCSDLAAAEAIRSRSGCAVQWTGLDEVMEGLGPSEKMAVIEMIKSRVKGLVLMIDHATEIKESFDRTVNIEYDGRESYVNAV